MHIIIAIHCPQCHSSKIVRNGKKYNGPQNHDVKTVDINDFAAMKRPVGDVSLLWPGMVKIMLVRGIRHARHLRHVPYKHQNILNMRTSAMYRTEPRQKHYDTLEIDDFLTYGGNKTNKMRLIYRYHRVSGETGTWIWGTQDLKRAKKLRKRL